jgi:hypothetical protein
MVTDIGQHDFAMEQKEREKQPPVSTTTFSSSFQICFPYFPVSISDVGKEVEERWDIVWEDVGCTGLTTPAL